MNLGGFGQVVSGDKPVKVQAEINQKQLFQASIYIFAAMFLAVLLAGFINRKAVA